MNRQTTMSPPADAERSWHLIDAQDQVVGRLATRIAMILMGKHRPGYLPHVDTGDFIVVVNAAGLRLTGRKGEQKFVKSYSGYPGGLRTVSYGDMLAKRPERLLQMAVRRMLPKNHLGRQMLKKLKIYAGAEHPHHAQQPQELAV